MDIKCARESASVFHNVRACWVCKWRKYDCVQVYECVWPPHFSIFSFFHSFHCLLLFGVLLSHLDFSYNLYVVWCALLWPHIYCKIEAHSVDWISCHISKHYRPIFTWAHKEKPKTERNIYMCRKIQIGFLSSSVCSIFFVLINVSNRLIQVWCL